ncbi:MAG: hypothetical protein NTW87_09350 [Planctomycetota bacterium]|nr:hypothetical protein [Planctomycetota bacterium]
MPYLLAAFVVLLLVAILAGCGAKDKPAPPTSEGGNPAPVALPDKGGGVTRDQVRQRLQELSGASAPKQLKIGAMCYEPMAAPNTADYVCPKCGQKTLYALADSGSEQRKATWEVMARITNELPACRRAAKEISGLAVELDESQFCKQCSPDVTKPQLVLVVKYPDQAAPHRVTGVTADDLRLVKEFLVGARKHVFSNDGETPLKQHMPRLEQLLGVKP